MVMDIKDLDRINLLYSKVRIIEEDISWLHRLANQVNKEKADILSLSLKHSFYSSTSQSVLTSDGSIRNLEGSIGTPYPWVNALSTTTNPSVTETDFNLNDVEIYFVLSSLLHVKRGRRDELIKQLNELL